MNINPSLIAPTAAGFVFGVFFMRFLYRARPKESRRRKFVRLTALAVIYSAVLVGLYFVAEILGAHTAFEVPIPDSGPASRELECWLTLPPGQYCASILSFPDTEAGVTVSTEPIPYVLEYSIDVDDSWVDGGGNLEVAYLERPSHVLFDNSIIVWNSEDVVHISIRITSALKDTPLPEMRLSIQVADEMHMKKNGLGLTTYTSWTPGAVKEDVLKQVRMHQVGGGPERNAVSEE
jgi:hypothetical protein